MITIPTPFFILLLCLSLPTVCALLAMIFILYLAARFLYEEKQREKRANEEAVKWVEMYLRKTGGKKWMMH
jgi:hypothetical protein